MNMGNKPPNRLLILFFLETILTPCANGKIYYLSQSEYQHLLCKKHSCSAGGKGAGTEITPGEHGKAWG